MKRFTDSYFLIVAWRQQLETMPPSTQILVDGGSFTVCDALALLRGERVDPDAVTLIGEYLSAVVSEACRAVRGKFAIGLQPTKK